MKNGKLIAWLVELKLMPLSDYMCTKVHIFLLLIIEQIWGKFYKNEKKLMTDFFNSYSFFEPVDKFL